MKKLTKKQAELVQYINSIRHNLHSKKINLFKFYISGKYKKDLGKEQNFLTKWGIDLKNLVFSSENSGLQRQLLALDLPPIDLYTGVTEELIHEIFQNSHAATYYQEIKYYEFLEILNKNIEDYLRNIDEEYGTHYSPTGISRMIFNANQTLRDKGFRRKFR